MEQLVVRRPPRSRLQRAVPADRRAAHPAGGGRDRGCRSARRCSSRWPAGASARTPGSARCGSAPAPRTNLFTGRLTFAFGLLPASAARWRCSADRPGLAAGARASLTALASPVAALFAALAGGGATPIGAYLSERRAPRRAARRVAVIAARSRPVLAAGDRVPRGRQRAVHVRHAVADPAIALLVAARADPQARRGAAAPAIVAVRARLHRRLRGRHPGGQQRRPAGPAAGGAARRAALVAPPQRCAGWSVALPLLYFQWQAPIRDVRTSAGDPSVDGRLLPAAAEFLEAPARARRSGSRSRSRGFTGRRTRWRREFPLARGWERQLDIKYNACSTTAR